MVQVLLRRVLWWLATFLGILALTFGVLQWMGRSLDGDRDSEVELARTRISAEDARRIRQDQGLDLPVFFNPRVEDAAGFVAAAAERVVQGFESAAELAELPASEWPAVAERLMATVHPGQRAVSRSGPILPEPGRGDAAFRIEGANRRLEAVAEDLRVLSTLGGQTVAGLAVADLLRSGPASAPAEAARRCILDAARIATEGCARELPPRPAASDLEPWLERSRESLSSQSIERSVREFLERLQQPESGEAEPGEAEAALRTPGGLALPALVPRLLEADAAVKARAVRWLARYGGFAGGYALADDPAQREIQDARLARWWRHTSHRHRTAGPLDRRLVLPWTQTRFGRFLGNLASGDFGESLTLRRPVGALLRERLARTLSIQIPALLAMLLFGIPLGIFAALREGRVSERSLGYGLLLLASTPRFLGGTLLILLLGGVLPVAGVQSPEVQDRILSGEISPWSVEALMDQARHLLLPVLVLAYGGIVVVARHVRSSMAEALRSDPVVFALARGVGRRRAVLRHALPLALLPLVTLLGIMVPGLIGGSVVVEQLFSIPGTGALMWRAAMYEDIPLVMALVTLGAIATLASYALADAASALLDPRVRRPWRG